MRKLFPKKVNYSKALIFLLLYLVVVIYQTLLAEVLSLGPARLDLSILVLIYVTLTRGTKQGIVFGFGLGILLDALNPAWLGLGSLIKGTLAYLIGYFKEKLFVENIFSKILLLFLTVLGNDVLYYLFLYKFNLDRIGSVLLGVGLPSALYTTAVAVVALLLTQKKPLPAGVN